MAGVRVQVCSTIQCFFEITRKAIALLHRHFNTYALLTHILARRIDFNSPNSPKFFTAKVSYYTVYNFHTDVDYKGFHKCID